MFKKLATLRSGLYGSSITSFWSGLRVVLVCRHELSLIHHWVLGHATHHAIVLAHIYFAHVAPRRGHSIHVEHGLLRSLPSHELSWHLSWCHCTSHECIWRHLIRCTACSVREHTCWILKVTILRSIAIWSHTIWLSIHLFLCHFLHFLKLHECLLVHEHADLRVGGLVQRLQLQSVASIGQLADVLLDREVGSLSLALVLLDHLVKL